MTKKKFQSVRRKLSPSEKERFERGKKAAAAERSALETRARTRSSELAELRNALQLLKGAREAAGLSLAEVARRSGIDKSRLSKLESDPHPNPTLGTLSRIAEAVGVKLTIRIDAA